MKIDSIKKPGKVLVPREQFAATLARWHGHCRIEEKLDGVFATELFESSSQLESLLAGERIRGRGFFAFDILRYRGEEVSGLPLRERLPLFTEIVREAGLPTAPVCPGVDAAESFLADVLARGGEGVVIKDLAAPYGGMFAVKRRWEGVCRITGFNGGTQSVQIGLGRGAEDWGQRTEDGGQRADYLNSGMDWVPCGSVALFGGKCDQVRVGSLIKVTGMNLTAAGRIREPRLDNSSGGQSWLVRF